jgi:hypothetical protein
LNSGPCLPGLQPKTQPIALIRALTLAEGKDLTPILTSPVKHGKEILQLLEAIHLAEEV